MDDIGILPGFEKTMVHDFWKPYYKYDSATHGICNAHIIRELVYAEEEMKQGWALCLCKFPCILCPVVPFLHRVNSEKRY